MPIEEDDSFVSLVAEKQHRELMGAIKTLVSALQKLESNDTKAYQAIHKNSESIVSLIGRISEQKPPEMPNINISQDAVIAELRNLCYEFKELTQAIKNKKTVQWEFSIERGFGNNIEKIKAKPNE